MGVPRPAELVLGSVQLGLPYGAANRTGMPSHEAALRLVRRASDAGIVTFDTARSYGESENRLGEALHARKPVRTITKLSALDELMANASRADVRAAVDASVAQSLEALQRDQIDCLLLHRANHMTGFGGAVWDRLLELLEDGTVLGLGVSVQTPDEALVALASPDVQHMQLPFNLLDWRWWQAGVIDAIRTRAHITVHVRSVFLQGILAANDASLWPNVPGVDVPALVAQIASLATQFDRVSAADLCLAYVRGQDWIDGVVVGMETEDQLNDNLALFVRHPLDHVACAQIAAQLPHAPEQLLNPALWNAGA